MAGPAGNVKGTGNPVASGGFEVDPALISASGAQIRSAALAMAGHTASFQQELAGYQPWGNDSSDMVSSLIRSCYQAISGMAMQSFTENTSAMDRMGAGLQVMAGRYDQAEDTNTGTINRIRQALG
jgi:hypothetical protein